MFYFYPKCTAVAQENLNGKVEETFFQKVALQQGGRSCAKAGRAFAEEFGFGRKF